MIKIFLTVTITLIITGTSYSQSNPTTLDENRIVEVNFKERNSLKPFIDICPVEGKKINNELPYIIFENKIYGFCCEGCDEAFLKNPKAYENKPARRQAG